MLKKSFAFRIFLLNFGLLILPVILYFSLFSRWEYDAKISKVLFELHDVGNSRAALLSEAIAADNVNINLVASGADFANQKTLEKVKAAGGYTAVSYYEKLADGAYIARVSTDPMIVGKDFAFREYVKYAEKYGSSSQVAYGGLPHEWPLLFVSKAIYSPKDHSVIGVFVVVSNISEFLQRLVDTRQISRHARFSLLTEDEIVFVTSDPALERKMMRPLSQERVDALNQGKQFGSFPLVNDQTTFIPIGNIPDSYEWEIDGSKRVGVKIAVPGTDLSFLLDENKRDVIFELYDDMGKIGLFFLLIIIVVGILNILIIKRLASPLNHLFEVMHLIGKGDYKIRFKSDPMGYEINSIGEALNQMTGHLLRNIDHVKEERLKKELLVRELGIGRAIQKSILPQEMPLVEGVEVVGRSIPAQEVGGDFYDAYIQPQDHKLIVTVGDASGKGISSCLYSLVLRSFLRSFGMQESNLANTVKRSNNLFCQDTMKTSNFVSCIIVAYDPTSRRLNYCVEGHCPGIIMNANGDIRKLNTAGIALGVMPLESIEEKSDVLETGELLFLYTNGVFTVMEEERLLQWLKVNRGLSALELSGLFSEKIASAFASEKQRDDITYVFMKAMPKTIKESS